MRRSDLFIILACVVIVSFERPARGDEAAAKARLAAKGIRVTRSELSLTDELELNKGFADAAALKRKLASAAKELRAWEVAVEQDDDMLRERMKADIQINAQLAAIGQTNIVEHNQLVGAHNANVGAIELLRKEQDATRKEMDHARNAANSAREKYVQRIVQIRKTADRLSSKYAELAEDEEARSAVREWNAAASTSLTIERSRPFQSNLKKLEALERSIRSNSDTIPLRREGNSYYATVVINGEHTHDMVVDTGANALVLPYKIAADCKVTPGPSDPKVIVSVADGSKVESRLVTLDSVRVGKFTAEKVDCIVLPPEARRAPLLLGMTFLRRFNFSMNGTELVLSKFDSDAARAPKRKTGATKKPASRPKSTVPSE